MFFRKIITTLALCAPIASALILDTPSAALVAGDPMEVAWESSASDPTEFTLFLLDAANLPFGLEADFGEVETSAGIVTVTLPDTLTTKSYQLRAVNSSSVDFVYASSADFVITAA
ncbi:hypothetical protein J3R30DRAFT_3700355 [Lentinula aciculospora]|uniref:Yeast cell wall synthesis Kre9/Knh1-like N-terminal domain-containing protein n=1 Tax=Lentinula aciculospora TaxID=153920 RepID=A0A9W9DQD3_9AGAR|nr:hypothetical protein J3R30DRAFT_3700355 [Lentinula aciculospora]